MIYQIVPVLDRKQKSIGELTCDDDGKATAYTSADGKESVMFAESIARGETMDVVMQRYTNFAFVSPDKESPDGE